MGRKLLFVLGIIAAHGALGAVWVGQEVPETRPLVGTCVNTSAPLLYFDQQRREILAMHVEVTRIEAALLP
jgi:hypothetical protein